MQCYYVCIITLTRSFYKCNTIVLLYNIILYFYSLFKKFFQFFLISKTFFKKKSLEAEFPSEKRTLGSKYQRFCQITNYLITTSFHESDGTSAIYVLPTFNTNSLPFSSKYCVGLVISPFFHVIGIILPFTA